MSPEFLEALRLVEEYDRQRPKTVVEYRLYYDEEGHVTGYCETDHPPETNYIVLDNPDLYFRTNTQSLRVIDQQLKIIDLTAPAKIILTKSGQGQPVVAGMAALALYQDETYDKIEYYDRPTNN